MNRRCITNQSSQFRGSYIAEAVKDEEYRLRALIMVVWIGLRLTSVLILLCQDFDRMFRSLIRVS